MIGLPGSGKSTLRNKLLSDLDDVFIYSTDDVLESIAKKEGATYAEVFQKNISIASQECDSALNEAIKENRSVLWDQTNTGLGKRRKILGMFDPKIYDRICYCIIPPRNDEEQQILQDRLSSRSKPIPSYVIESMRSSYVEPSLKEGFDKIVFVNMKD